MLKGQVLNKQYISRGPDETKDIGYKLGKILMPGDVVGLYGELGSGKTTMVKGIAHALGIEEKEIMSASFTIIAEYDSNPPFSHIDLYRIEKDSELDEIGIWEHLGGSTISVIEWAEKAEKGLPEDVIRVSLNVLDKDIRKITIECLDEKDWNHL